MCVSIFHHDVPQCRGFYRRHPDFSLKKVVRPAKGEKKQVDIYVTVEEQ